MITSYGLLVLDSLGDELRVLICSRRDTYSYIMLLNGMWTQYKNIIQLLQTMTEEERHRIIHYPFDELWDDLYVNHQLRVYRNRRSKSKYNTYQKGIKNCAASIRPQECQELMKMWEFPKGKKEGMESTIQCALREFQEETRLDPDDFRLLSDIPIGVKFMGTDHRQYEVFYYLAETKRPITFPPPLQLPDHIRRTTHSAEVEDIRWVSIDQAMSMISTPNRSVLKKATDLYRECRRMTPN